VFSRRRFVQLLGVVVGIGSLNGCEFESADKQLVVKAPKDTTVVEALHATGHYPAIVQRNFNGQTHNFVVGLDGQYEQPEQGLYWLFWVNDQIVTGPLDEVVTKNGDRILAVRMVPSMLHA